MAWGISNVRMLLFGPFFYLFGIGAGGCACSLFKNLIKGGFGIKTALKGMSKQGQFFASRFLYTFFKSIHAVLVHIFIEVFGKAAVDGVGNLSGVFLQTL